MHQRTDIGRVDVNHALAYRYDGTFDGLMCCVFESFKKKERPAMLLSNRQDQTTLFPARDISTDPARARRVVKGIAGRISEEVLEHVQQAFLSCEAEADLIILDFLHLAFRAGPGVLDMLAEPEVDRLIKALRHLWGEAHLLTGFIRFSDNGGALVATIEPKNRVLPLLDGHFSDRYNAELFMIYDQTHREALVHQDSRSAIFPVERLELPDPGEGERFIRQLWKRFYGAIGVKERENPRCRMTHMPKRYWAHMLEMEEELGKARAIGDARREELWYNRQGLEMNDIRDPYEGVNRHGHSDLLPQAQSHSAQGRALLQGAQDRLSGGGPCKTPAGDAGAGIYQGSVGAKGYDR